MPGIFSGVFWEDDVFSGQGFDDPGGYIVLGNDFTDPVGRLLFLDGVTTKSEFPLFEGNPAIRAAYDNVVEYAHIQVLSCLDEGPCNGYVIIIYMENL